MRNAAAILGLVVLATPAMAQDEGAACPPGGAAPPAELAGWRAPAAALAPSAPLVLGTAGDLALRSETEVQLVAAPGKASAAGSHAALAPLVIAAPGLYRAALGGPAWVDIVVNGKAAASVAHAHGPACTGIRKMVDFRLPAGRHLVQIAGSPAATIKLMVVRLPEPARAAAQ